jgi:hypothetical protein
MRTFRTIVITVITTVLAGILLVYLRDHVIWTTATPTLDVRAETVTVPNPNSFIDKNTYPKLDEFVKTQLGFSSGLSPILQRLSDSQSASIMSVIIENSSKLRSRTIELLSDDAAFWYLADGSKTCPQAVTGTKYIIPQLDPEHTCRVVVLGSYGNLVALHDGQQLEVFQGLYPYNEAEEERDWIDTLWTIYDWLSGGALVLVLVVILLVPTLLSNFQLLAKLIPARLARLLNRFLDYLHEHNPSKLAK